MSTVLQTEPALGGIGLAVGFVQLGYYCLGHTGGQPVLGDDGTREVRAYRIRIRRPDHPALRGWPLLWFRYCLPQIRSL